MYLRRFQNIHSGAEIPSLSLLLSVTSILFYCPAAATAALQVVSQQRETANSWFLQAKQKQTTFQNKFSICCRSGRSVGAPSSQWVSIYHPPAALLVSSVLTQLLPGNFVFDTLSWLLLHCSTTGISHALMSCDIAPVWSYGTSCGDALIRVCVFFQLYFETAGLTLTI